MTNKVAVYGSLRKGLHNNSLLRNAQFLGEALTTPEFQLVSLGSFPAIKEGNSAVKVEVYRVDKSTMQSLDWLEGYRGEGCNNFYDKELIDTPYGKAYIYTMRGCERHSSVVDSGDWTTFLQQNV